MLEYDPIKRYCEYEFEENENSGVLFSGLLDTFRKEHPRAPAYSDKELSAKLLAQFSKTFCKKFNVTSFTKYTLGGQISGKGIRGIDWKKISPRWTILQSLTDSLNSKLDVIVSKFVSDHLDYVPLNRTQCVVEDDLLCAFFIDNPEYYSIIGNYSHELRRIFISGLKEYIVNHSPYEIISEYQIGTSITDTAESPSPIGAVGSALLGVAWKANKSHLPDGHHFELLKFDDSYSQECGPIWWADDSYMFSSIEEVESYLRSIHKNALLFHDGMSDQELKRLAQTKTRPRVSFFMSNTLIEGRLFRSYSVKENNKYNNRYTVVICYGSVDWHKANPSVPLNYAEFYHTW